MGSPNAPLELTLSDQEVKFKVNHTFPYFEALYLTKENS